MDTNNESAIIMNCDIGVNDDNISDKRNMSVILVPENVLQVLSDSTTTTSNSVDKNSVDVGTVSGVAESNIFVDPNISSSDLNNKNVFIVSNDNVNFEENSELDGLKTSDVLILDSNNICLVGVGGLSAQEQATKPVVNEEPHGNVTIKPRPFKPLAEATKEILSHMDGFIESWKTKHDKSNKKTVKYKCKVFNCNKTFNTQKDLETHSIKHLKCERYPCSFPLCPWSFSTPYKLKRHLKSHDQIKQYKCTYAGCNKICSTKYNLQVHLNMMHSKTGAVRTCPECKQSFNHSAQLLKHMRTVHNAAPMYACEECGKKFHTTSGRNTHAKSHIQREYICGVEGCGKHFKRRAIFKIHVMEHSNIKPFKCDYPDCQWAFTTRGKLKRHLLSHSNTKRFQCPLEHCTSRFTRLEHLKTHLNAHALMATNDGNDSSELQTPIETNDDNLLYYLCPYEECGSLFTTMTGAKQHIQKVHTPTNLCQQLSAKEPDIVLENQPVSITLEGMKTNNDLINDNMVSDDTSGSEKIVASDPESTESLLKTMLQENTSNIQSSDDILITSVTSHAPGAQAENTIYIDTIKDSKSSHSQTLDLSTSNIFSPTQGLMSSPTTTIDPSQFLLGATEDYSAESEAMKYINLPQYPPSSSTDRFLNFSECVHTVDPNMVMSIPVPLFQGSSSTVSSSCETSDDDDDDSCDTNNNMHRTSGSARTDVFMHRKINFRGSFCSPLKQNTTSSHSKSLSESGNTGSDFDIHSFIFHDVDGKNDISSISERSLLEKRTCISDDQFIKDSHGLQGDFPGSTINLNDLA